MRSRNSGDPVRGILAAVIIQAVKDAQRGRCCSQHCKSLGHVCRGDAAEFLRSDWCATILEFLGLAYLQEQVEQAAAGR